MRKKLIKFGAPLFALTLMTACGTNNDQDNPDNAPIEDEQKDKDEELIDDLENNDDTDNNDDKNNNNMDNKEHAPGTDELDEGIEDEIPAKDGDINNKEDKENSSNDAGPDRQK